jgi:DNA adenine methylase
MKSILRWAGSKQQLIPRLLDFWPGPHTRYIEPFCGSACLFFALQPETAILGDLNRELVETYRALKRDAPSVVEMLRSFRKGKRNYYKLRSADPRTLSQAGRAARFLFLNRHCFNGIYRTNSNGQFNVPYGPQKQDTPIDEAAMLRAADALQSARIISGDFSKTLKNVRKGDFVYLDPPYAVKKRRVFREYHPDSFQCDDLKELATWLRRINRIGAYFVVSYGDSREARELLAPWSPKRVRTRRNVAGFADHRRYAFELIGTNIARDAE